VGLSSVTLSTKLLSLLPEGKRLEGYRKRLPPGNSGQTARYIRSKKDRADCLEEERTSIPGNAANGG
jgi:hypothetical protein